MTRLLRASALAFVPLCFGVVGCSGDKLPGTLPGADATVSVDGGAAEDSGLAAEDAGGAVDAGAGDAGLFEDAGGMDAGAEVDTGVAEDSGVEADAGPPADAGEVADAGSTDGGPADGGPADGGQSDGGAVDSGQSDAGPGDSGLVADGGGAMDAGTPVDAGSPPDAGGTDAGPGTDAGGTDAGAADAGVVAMCNPAFDAADACGGDPVGTWNYQAACTNQTPFAMTLAGCPTASVNNVVQTAGGTLVLDANGTFVRTLNTTVSGQLLLPATCLPTGLTCGLLGSFIPSFLNGATGSCTGTTTCDCQVTVVTSQQDSGGWVASGGVISTAVGSDTRQYWYCVDPNQSLEYRGLPANLTDNDTTYLLTP